MINNAIYQIFYNFFGINTKIFLVINSFTNIGYYPLILKSISQLFFFTNFIIYYILTCCYFWYLIKFYKLAYSDFLKIYSNLSRIAISYIIFVIIFTILKFFINLPRPFCSLPAKMFITIIDTTNISCQSSFPSAHTGLSMLITYFFWPYSTKIIRVLLYLIIILVIISRITLAVHYPADTLYSVFIVKLVIIITNYIYPIVKNNLTKHYAYKLYKKIAY